MMLFDEFAPGQYVTCETYLLSVGDGGMSLIVDGVQRSDDDILLLGNSEDVYMCDNHELLLFKVPIIPITLVQLDQGIYPRFYCC